MTPYYAPEAAAELHEAAEWYEGQRAGLGDEFLDEVKATVQAIAAHPEHFARYEGQRSKVDVRRALVNRFPYVVLFEVVDENTRILSVSHGHRKPGHWRGR